MSDAEFQARMEVLTRRMGVSARVSDRADPKSEWKQQPASEWQKESRPERVHNAVAGSSAQGSARAQVGQTSSQSPLDYSTFSANECVSQDVTFSSWKWVQAYPSCFIGKANAPRAKPYFDKIFENRVWDFFFLYDPENKETEPHLLVPSVQFDAFLSGINKELGTALTVPPGKQDRYQVRFGEGGTPRPRYLKRTRNQKTLEIEHWPRLNPVDVQAFQRADAFGKACMREKLKLMSQANLSAQADKKHLKMRQQTMRRRERQAMLDRVQAYLGLTGNYSGSVVFVSVDVEAQEVYPKAVTEVGISVLDTDDLYISRPGPRGEGWWSCIQSYHVRIEEHVGYRNYRFVQGCPDDFDFGSSTFVWEADVADYLNSVLEPFTDNDRRIVLVGHDLRHDIDYLEEVGFSVQSINNVVDHCDSKVIHQAWKGLDSGRSLETVLGDLDIPYRYLHNAGNDAAYTLQALVGVAVEALSFSQRRY